jgi:hypothetical protein
MMHSIRIIFVRIILIECLINNTRLSLKTEPTYPPAARLTPSSATPGNSQFIQRPRSQTSSFSSTIRKGQHGGKTSLHRSPCPVRMLGKVLFYASIPPWVTGDRFTQPLSFHLLLRCRTTESESTSYQKSISRKEKREKSKLSSSKPKNSEKSGTNDTHPFNLSFLFHALCMIKSINQFTNR